MIEYKIEPWPSTYEMLGEIKPRHLTSRFGRKVGAFRTAIPANTIEPVQVHLIAPRDGQPFEEMITDFNMPFHVALLNMKTGQRKLRKYMPGENIVIPEYVVHWLINNNDQRLEFTCEYAPHPWDGVNDEPEFSCFESLLAFVDREGLRQKLVEANSS